MSVKLLFKDKTWLNYSMVFAMILGMAVGSILGEKALFLGETSKGIITLIKILAAPLVFFTIAQTAMSIDLKAQNFIVVISFAMFNSVLALIIATCYLNFLKPGIVLRDLFLKVIDPGQASKSVSATHYQLPAKADEWVWTSLLEPFIHNSILSLVIFAVVIALIYRQLLSSNETSDLQKENLKYFYGFIDACLLILQKIISAVLFLLPIAIFSGVAKTVGEYGLISLVKLMYYVLVCLLALFSQVLLVYGAWFKFYLKRPYWKFLKTVWPTLVAALGSNSSLATLPMTIKNLEDHGVKKKSITLGACIATNFNNDGILLYEALAAAMIFQAINPHFYWLQQVQLSALCLLTALGVAGIPEAGIIALSLILTQFKLPLEILPLLLSVDWIIARVRSLVNVFVDMSLSMIYDEWENRQSIH